MRLLTRLAPLYIGCHFFTAISVFAAEPGSFTKALELALRQPTTPLSMTVGCTDEAGIRSMEVYPGGAVIWGREWQAQLDLATRNALLQALLHADFAHFAPHYGGKAKAAEQEAALRVMCRILVEVAGEEKSSVQEVDGKRSAELLALADTLLDLVQALEARGVSADSLTDGLRKLRSGTLAPEALAVSYLYLPSGDAFANGLIVEVSGGQVAVRAYRPGSGTDQASTYDLAGAILEKIMDELLDAGVSELPLNLYAENLHQLEVRVLAHRSVVVARPFSRNRPNQQDGRQDEDIRRFLQLTEALRGFANPEDSLPKGE